MIIRHPEEHKLLQQMKDNALRAAPILMTAPSIHESQTTEQLLNFVDSNMAQTLSNIFGASAGKVSGKYKRADFFAFLCQGGTIIATPEKGDRGTSWYYVPKENEDIPTRQYLLLEHPSVINILPAFFTELHQKIYGTDLDSKGFGKKANRLRHAFQQDENAQGSSPKASAKKRAP